ncbi:FAD-dependent oxidoreductase [Streptomyces sp. H10-C2]|uniref:FAD-dependent oxidoreductase n=1 Tax=unclassified Streptomyces TaxID=2593676 RepID=UPI0024B8EB1B|nr:MULTISPECIES: FAD-dependent oxidoreductase [unclassified Streptomyces]MDJ0346852.1 FAD-dependent oxidoreductase [Streptomyces sp. PH10-H1]MDJ0372857.1 FAD-dependent oxidoreductase [Streptomyces sp. H10-C2]
MINRRSLLRTGGALALGASVVGNATSASAAGGGAAGPGWDKLRSIIQGDVVLPSDAAYETAKQGKIAEYDSITPEGIVYGESVADATAAIRFARDNGLQLRTRSGGHNFAGWSTGEGLVLDVSRINHIKGGGNPTVHLGPGAHSIDAVTALKPYNQQLVTGTCPTVCPGGFFSGGGIGYQSRAYGIGSDRVVSALVALADGTVVRASETQHADLLWGLRGGGGGNFGVVLDFEVRPIAAPRMVFYEQIWNWDDAQEFLPAWQAWYAESPRNSSAQVIIVVPDAAPGNAPFILQQGCFYGPKSQADTALAELTSQIGRTPVSSTVLDLPFDEGMHHVYGLANEASVEAVLARTPWQRMRTRMVEQPFDAAGAAAALAAFDADRRPGQTRYLSFMGLGGAAGDPSPTATAYVHRDTLFHVGYGIALQSPTPAPEDAAAAIAWTTKGFNTIAPLSNGQSYINFPDPLLPDWQAAYYGQNYPRLLQVNKRYDPDNFFTHPRAIGA